MITPATSLGQSVDVVRDRGVACWDGECETLDILERVPKSFKSLDDGVLVVLVAQPGELADDSVERAVDGEFAAGGLAISDVLGNSDRILIISIGIKWIKRRGDLRLSETP